MPLDVIETTGADRELVRYRVEPTYHDGVPPADGALDPVRVRVESRRLTLQEYLTVDEARDLGAALMATALHVEISEQDGSVMGASERLIDTADRFNQARLAEAGR